MSRSLVLPLLVTGSVFANGPEVPLVLERIPPVKAEISSGKASSSPVLFADFGGDAYGNLELSFGATPPKGPIKVRLGEKLDGTGSIDQKPPGSVNYREIPLLIRGGGQVHRLAIPRKPGHNNSNAIPVRAQIGEITPFRYVEIEGADFDPQKTVLTQLAVHVPFDDSQSSFESSDPTLNAVWDLCKHTMKATSAFGVFIDGERERIPYEGDSYINQLSFAACDPDPRIIRATFDYLMDHPTWPAEWLFHMPMMAVADFMATGDPSIASKHYDALKRRILERRTTPDGLLLGGGIVDWPPSERDGYNAGVPDARRRQQVGPEVNTAANAFYIHALGNMAFLAGVLGRQGDAREFSAREKAALASYNRVFCDPLTGLYTDGFGCSHSSLHANMFPLAFGLVPPEHVSAVAAFVKSRGMACSVFGAQYLLEALMASGLDREAVGLMASRSPRSWWHMIESGSTITWEAWDPSVKSNLTWNHAWGAAPANILSRFVLGVRPLEPGYSKILIAPQPGNLAWVKGRVPTVRGPVEINLINGKSYRLEVTIPVGVTAEVRLPAVCDGVCMLDGKPFEGKTPAVRIAGGHHVIESRMLPAN